MKYYNIDNSIFQYFIERISLVFHIISIYISVAFYNIINLQLYNNICIILIQTKGKVLFTSPFLLFYYYSAFCTFFATILCSCSNKAFTFIFCNNLSCFINNSYFVTIRLKINTNYTRNFWINNSF